jgi:hypothetical protein
MRHHFRLYLARTVLYFVGALAGAFAVAAIASPAPPAIWQSPAQWHRLLKKPVPGTLLIEQAGIEFRSAKFTRHWIYVEIHTFDLLPHELTLTNYEDRHWHEPGERRYHFTFMEPVPASVAAQLTRHVGKPVRDGVPSEKVKALAEIPARLRARFGGSNGTLRLRNDGIDYVTDQRHDARSWRWADIETLANPNPYELRVTAYREIDDFDLKQPLPRAIFERLWDRLYANGLNLTATGGDR